MPGLKRLALGPRCTTLCSSWRLSHRPYRLRAVVELAEAVEDADNFQGDELIGARMLWRDKRKARRGRSNWGLEPSNSRK